MKDKFPWKVLNRTRYMIHIDTEYKIVYGQLSDILQKYKAVEVLEDEWKYRTMQNRIWSNMQGVREYARAS